MLDWNIILIVLSIILALQIISNCNIDYNRKDKNNKNNKKNSERFAPYLSDDLAYNASVDSTYYVNTPNVGWLSRRGLLPFWNSTRDTKNMSYDIRGDIPPFYHPVGPYLNPSVTDRPWGCN